MTEWEAWASDNAGLVQHKKSREAAEKAFRDQQRIINILREDLRKSEHQQALMGRKLEALMQTLTDLENLESHLKS